jgi:hypothetical protein
MLLTKYSLLISLINSLEWRKKGKNSDLRLLLLTNIALKVSRFTNSYHQIDCVFKMELIYYKNKLQLCDWI